MKLAILFLLGLFGGRLLYAQDQGNNFHIENGELVGSFQRKVLVWQKTFKTTTDQQGILREIRNKGIFQDLRTDSISFRGNFFLTSADIDYRDAGYKSIKSTPILFLAGKINAFAIIRFDPGQYTVIVKNIVSVLTEDTRSLGKKGRTVDIEYIAGGLLSPKSFRHSSGRILNSTFDKLFRI